MMSVNKKAGKLWGGGLTWIGHSGELGLLNVSVNSEVEVSLFY